MNLILYSLAKPLVGLLAGFTFVSTPMAVQRAQEAQARAMEAQAAAEAQLRQLEEAEEDAADEHEHADEEPARDQPAQPDR